MNSTWISRLRLHAAIVDYCGKITLLFDPFCETTRSCIFHCIRFWCHFFSLSFSSDGASSSASSEVLICSQLRWNSRNDLNLFQTFQNYIQFAFYFIPFISLSLNVVFFLDFPIPASSFLTFKQLLFRKCLWNSNSKPERRKNKLQNKVKQEQLLITPESKLHPV